VTEASQIYHVARERLVPYGRLVRLENLAGEGTPDWYYNLRARTGFVEAKIFDAEGRPRHLTVKQVRWGEDEVRWGGRWFLLGRLGNMWLLYDIKGASLLLGGEPSTPILRTCGPFPTRELLDILAPRLAPP
jgi:hypothetical protein